MSNSIIEYNPQRLEYILDLFGFSKEDLLQKLNDERTRKIKEQDIFQSNIQQSILKKIDSIFKQGLSFYTDPNSIEKKKTQSIFFRKSSFNAQIDLGDRLRVNEIERESSYLNGLIKLSDYPPLKRRKRYKLEDNPEIIAYQEKENFYPQSKVKDEKDFLKAFINQISKQNIFVFEFVEQHNLKYKSNSEGFFISPNIIAIKRQQNTFKREIFTLAHELGHYLLDKEELDPAVVDQQTNNEIEKWCNEFAFHFLIGKEKKKELMFSQKFSIKEGIIQEIVKKQYLSRLAIFTNLALKRKISWEEYNHIKSTIQKEYEKKKKKQERTKQEKKALGIKSQGRGAKPIRSYIEQDIYRTAFMNGNIGEYEVLKRFSSKDIDKVIYG